MRNTFNKKLIEFAKKDKDIYLLTADLGYNSFENFKNLFPKRFINVGVAENNLVGIACGLALRKKKVYVYSILPFLIFKSFEQIRNNICHNNLNIKLIGGGGGFSYSVQGISHNTSEDISVLRSMPNIEIFNPGTIKETEKTMDAISILKSPCFVRLGKAPKVDYSNLNNFDINKPNIFKKGKDLVIFTSGNIIQEVNDSCIELENNKINVKIVSVAKIKPISVLRFKKLINNNHILVIEEHSDIGGLASIIRDIIVNNELKYLTFNKINLQDIPHKLIGSQEYQRKVNKLDKENIISKIKKIIKK